LPQVKLPVVQPGAVSSGVVLLGIAFSFASALVPHFESAHRLLGIPFALGVALYGIYGVIAALVPRSVAARLGLRVLGLHVVMALLLRGTLDQRMVEGWLALVPTLLIIYVLVDTYLRRRQGPAS
jgi:hypothetical protein